VVYSVYSPVTTIERLKRKHVPGNSEPRVNKRTIIRYGLAFAAIIGGFVIIKVSINNAWTIKENIVSCIPEELSELFDHEQSIICSSIQSQKSVLMGSVFLGAGLAIAGFIIAFVGFMKALMHKDADKKSLRV
jgi:hypothetical protein